MAADVVWALSPPARSRTTMTRSPARSTRRKSPGSRSCSSRPTATHSRHQRRSRSRLEERLVHVRGTREASPRRRCAPCGWGHVVIELALLREIDVGDAGHDGDPRSSGRRWRMRTGSRRAAARGVGGSSGRGVLRQLGQGRTRTPDARDRHHVVDRRRRRSPPAPRPAVAQRTASSSVGSGAATPGTRPAGEVEDARARRSRSSRA